MKILKFKPFKSILVLMPLLLWVESVVAQNGGNPEADEAIVFKLLKVSDDPEDHYSDAFVERAIEVAERRSNPNLLPPLANFVLKPRVSENSQKRIKDFLSQQLGSSNPSVRKTAVYYVSFVEKKASVPSLLRAVEDEDQRVRIAALSQLRVYASPPDIQTIEELLRKRRAEPGVGDKDTTLVFGREVVEILRQLEGGYDDPSRFDDATLIDVVLPRVLLESDHYSDALVLRVIETLKKMRGIAAQNLLSILGRFAEGDKISPESRERIVKVFAEELDRVSEREGKRERE